MEAFSPSDVTIVDDGDPETDINREVELRVKCLVESFSIFRLFVESFDYCFEEL